MDALDAAPFWDRTIWWWHVSLVAAIAAAAGVATADRLGTRYPVFLAGLAAVAVLYTTVGVRELRGEPQWWAWAYLVPSWLIFLSLIRLTTTAEFLLFALFPQTWAMVSRAAAAAISLLAMAAAFGIRLGAGDPLGAAAISIGVEVAMSLLLGFWVNGIAIESERRRDLALELRAARDELAVAERAAGTLAERARLSQEIHDTLAQGFTSLLTLAQAAEAELPPGADRVGERLRLMQDVARQNLAEARALVADLAPAGLSAAVLESAVRRAGERFTEQFGVPASVTVAGTPHRLPRRADVVVLRTLQEALTNAGRHAAAQHVAVCLDHAAGGTTLVVTDDGCGLPGDGTDGFGLAGMRARAAEIGATLSVTGRPGHGTTVRLEVVT